MATRIAAAAVLVGIGSLGVATVVGVDAGSDLDTELTNDQIAALRLSGDVDISSYFGSLSRTTSALAASPQAGVVIERLSSTLDEIGDVAPSAAERERLAVSYLERFVEPQRQLGRDVELRDVVPADDAAARVQLLYASDPDNVAAPRALDDAGDGSLWSESHREVHPVYRDVASRLGLFDLLLVDDSGRVVYSVEKHPEIGTDLATGPFSGSVLDVTVSAVLEAPDEGVEVSDLADYLPALGEPVGVVAHAVFEPATGDAAGALVLMFRGSDLTERITAGENWPAAGFPEGADTYLVGPDGTLRSDPRGYLESPAAYLDAVEDLGRLTADERSTIGSTGTVATVLRARDDTVNAGRGGAATVDRRASIVGVDVVSTSAPLSFGGLDWLVVSEIEVEAAEGGFDDFRRLLTVGAAIFVVLLAFAAVAWANSVVRPIRSISDRLGSSGSIGDPIEIPPQSPIEFAELAIGFETMAATLAEQQSELERALAERLRVLRELLPPAEAERVILGEEHAPEEVRQATIAVVVFDGLDEVVDDDTGSARSRVDELLYEVDAVALRHGLDRIKLIGDTYYASCGHDRPYIDHAPRSVAFAEELLDRVARFGELEGVDVRLGVGVHTGPVTAGLTGANHLLYDVWGDTVTVAHALARRGTAGTIVVSDAVRSRLPDGAVTLDPLRDDVPLWTVRREVPGVLT
ncbi:MAG: adenylate/guanylate cyclase domain-containing protein [Ilumatobacter sp.]|jgi:class 3 adenylate cyclase|uniref:adenylate/guanylate cyclase domain-containing protein n=1 Tax=Ilumatobacter sp. TaxID=1967498 RepID=UPI00391C44AC